MEVLNYKIDTSKLKERGYTFQKLYAANYKTYRKEINGRTIWLWEKGKMIEIDDWFNNTKAVLDFYKANRESELFNKLGLRSKEPLGFIKVHMNPENGHVQFYDYEAYFKVFEDKNWNEWDAKYKGWYEIVLYKETTDAILAEIEVLTA